MKIQEVTRQVRLKSWTEQVNDQVASGLSVESWCRTKGIHPNTYYYRLKQVRKEALTDVAVSRDHSFKKSEASSIFYEIPYDARAEKMGEAAIIIRTGNSTLEIYNGAECQVMEYAIMALREIC